MGRALICRSIYTDLFKVSCRGELDARIRSPPWFCSGNWLVSWTHLEHLIPLTDSVATVHPRPQYIWVAAGLASAQSLNCIPLAWSAYCIGCLPLRECTWYKGTSCIGLKFIFSTSISFRRSGYLGGTTGSGEPVSWEPISSWDPSICSRAWMRWFTSSMGWPPIACKKKEIRILDQRKRLRYYHFSSC